MVIQKEFFVDINLPIITTKKPSLFEFLNTRMSEIQKLIGCCLGIFICYFYYGILQEKITRVPYGGKQEKFTYQQTLVFVQCVVNAIFAKTIIKATHRSFEDKTPTLMYIWCAMSYMGAMLASNMSLRYVNYPTQVLGKSCKPIPVMILGVLLARKKYPLIKYLCVLMIVAGVALFFFKEKKGSTVESTGFGELLLVVSLALDGMTGASQERMRVEYKTQAHAMMYSVNKWSLFLLGTAIIFTGELFQFVAFCGRYPYVLWNMLLFSVASALGQNFIFTTVTNFGPLTCSVVTTTRKLFTILFSILFFGNPITTQQSFAVGLVFVGLGLDAIYGKNRKS
ncbi:solute carrier family 35 member B1-like [Hydractinia symbiolongicarpus]|uniref:solute carrier family 35 member B1-like n=1 Tax=Hydractinia symbiolongicarpus TaxID=13093 RepID=UPI0025502CA1|nr:solute carrier family 35 member B1-like [Hydractinia symbiolongicarpus]